MQNRYTRALETAGKVLREPTDLPNVIREDLLMLAPLNPWQLFATWHISYSTQNRLRDYIGEEEFDNCRLFLTLKLPNQDIEGFSIDVSGPSTTEYINLESLISANRVRLQKLNEAHVYGELSYRQNSTSYYVTRSSLITLPRAYISSRCDEEFPPVQALYERIYRRLDPQATYSGDLPSLVQLGEQLDAQLGIPAL